MVKSSRYTISQTGRTRADFNSDGHPDLIWQNPTTGAAQIWLLGGPQGTNVIGALTLALMNSWRIVGAADFNGDEHVDVVWQDPVSGAAAVWLLDEGGNLLISVALTGANRWRIRAVADFDNDGYPDCLWQDPSSGFAQIWFLKGPTTVVNALNLSAHNTWRIVGATDFNLDGKLDVVWQDPASGAIQIWYLGGTQGNAVVDAATVTAANEWTVVAVSDFNSDGHPDLLLQHPSTGTSTVWFFGGTNGSTAIGPAPLTGSTGWRIMGPR
jgi:hypothetical protein